ncbi:hypothetical protein CBR_g31059 [Chara braunii]|uniref:Reverse transcriptase domain-containing protein n=1 Tax=Chara braunii TaxID=69332 RepID=A0A388LE66_CHABU|nr:hypothetical protein CBR_g31059 [Chara braunii]|eukprot:GBG80599.1 hypothetical protein CBR_g31059 [Chara braunii]
MDVGSLKDRVQLQQTATQQLQQRICTTANTSSSEPRETAPKFDGQEIFCDSMKTDPVPWFRKFELTLQLHNVKEHKHHAYLYSRSGGACQAWLDNLLSKYGVVANDLHTKISCDDQKAAWHKRFQVEPPEIKAMDKLMVFEQGALPSTDWIAEYQRLTSVPDIQMGFKAIRHYFISRSCPALSNDLTHVEDTLTSTAELFDKAAQIIITNKEAKNLRSSASGPSRDQHRPRVAVVAATTPFDQTSEAMSASEGDRLAAAWEDDILVYSRTLEDHLGHLRRVLETLRCAKYKANCDKCEFVRQELEYLGHFVTPEGISLLSDKIQAIREWLEPRNVTDVRSFLGLAGYYQRFFKGYSKIAAHLNKLQFEDRPFDFREEARGSFFARKAALLSAEVLRRYDPLLPTREEEEEKLKEVEEEEEDETPLQRKRGQYSGSRDEEMEKRISEWVANLSLGEEEEAAMYISKDDQEATMRVREAEKDVVKRQALEDEKRMEWKLAVMREKKRRVDAAAEAAEELEEVKKIEEQLAAQTELPAQMRVIARNVARLARIQAEQYDFNRSQHIAVHSIKLGFQDFARELVGAIGIEVGQGLDKTGRFCVGAIEGVKAAAPKEEEARPPRRLVKKEKLEEQVFVAYVRPVTEPTEEKPMDPAIAKLLEEFKDLTEPPTGTVPRPIQHRIEIEPGSRTPKGAVYRMSPRELEELRKQLDELLEKGWIRPSSFPFGAPVLFVPKKEGKLRMCIDYRGLNAITVKNVEPLPRIDDLLDRVQGAKYFSKIDLKSGYHQIEVHPDDQYKTAFRTRYGHYEFIVMPFGLTNAQATFQQCMNDLFRPWLDRFVVVYLDNILVFSKTLEEHQGHLRQVLEKLREANFKINAKKCDWAKTQVLYLGHVLDGDDVKPEDSKIAALRDWPTPRTLTKLRSFLGLANYYRKFVRNFSTIVAPLRRLLRKETIWKWDKDCTSAMKKLKQALIEYPVLKVVDPSLPFVVTTDASQYGIGAVLQQDDGNGYRVHVR